MKRLSTAMIGAMFSLLAACTGEPSSTRTYPSPSGKLAIIVENFGGDGPLSADTTRVYAVRRSGSAAIKRLILEGEYLGLSSIEWTHKDEVRLSISSESMTSSFYNNTTLSDGKNSLKVHTEMLQIKH